MATNRRTLIYCRVSTDKQEKAATIDSQERECLTYAKENKLQVIRAAKESHTGAELHERPVLSAERERIRNGEYDVLLAHSIDRLSRNAAHLFILQDECQRHGVELRFVKDDLDATPEGKLMLSVKGFIAEVERLKIIERTTRGKRQRVERGKLITACPLYGYDTNHETSARTKNHEARIVRRIWDEGFAGFGAHAVARKLNLEGIPAPTSGKRDYKNGRTPKWSKSTILRIWREPAYAGQSVAYRWRHEKRPGRKYDRIIEHPRSEWTILSDALTPAIVTPAEYDRMQTLLSQRRCGDQARNELRPALLRGLIYCVCGRRRTPDEYAYRCVGRTETVPCKNGATTRRQIEEFAWSEMARRLADPAELIRLASALPDESERPAWEARAVELQAAIQKAENAQRRLVDALADSDDATTGAIKEKLRRVSNEARTLRAELDAVTRKLNAGEGERTDRIDLITRTQAALATGAHFDLEEKRQILLGLGVRIVADGNKSREFTLAAN